MWSSPADKAIAITEGKTNTLPLTRGAAQPIKAIAIIENKTNTLPQTCGAIQQIKAKAITETRQNLNPKLGVGFDGLLQVLEEDAPERATVKGSTMVSTGTWTMTSARAMTSATSLT